MYEHGGTHSYDYYENGHITLIRYGEKLTFSESEFYIHGSVHRDTIL